MRSSKLHLAFTAAAIFSCAIAFHAQAFDSPLKLNPVNPRYFTDNSGKAVYLTGSHTWESLQEIIDGNEPPFDYEHYLDVMQSNHHNFMRMWIWEQAAWMPGSENKCVIDPLPYMRTGPGLALDGGPKFDLTRWNQAFFDRLRSRVVEAGNKGIYVSIMLFDGWSVRKPWLPGDPWKAHPYNKDNNINGLNGDMGNDGNSDVHSLSVSSVTNYQKAFVKKVIDTVNDLDNVLYEIINEPAGDDRVLDWETRIVNFIHTTEAGMPKQHMVGVTPGGAPKEKTVLFTGKMDWMSPTYMMDPAYRTDPPVADGRKVMLNDTDHLDPQLAIDHKWVWVSFMRGLNPIFMDPWDTKEFIGADTSTPEFRSRIDLVRRNMGYTLDYANRINLQAMVPRNDLASTRFCLADPGSEYLVYLPDGGSVDVDLSGTNGALSVEWFDPLTGTKSQGVPITGGRKVQLTSPYTSSAAVYLKANK